MVNSSSRTRYVDGIVPPDYRYTFGLAGERFYREIAEKGRLMGTYCKKCATTHLPPRIYCEVCFEELTEWREVKGPGTVETFTISHIDEKGEKVPKPFVVALVGFRGVRGGLIHRLGGVRPAEVTLGMAVEPVFKPKPRRRGSILDILNFKPSKRQRA